MGLKASIKSSVPIAVKRRARHTQEVVRRQVRRPFKQPVLRAALADIESTAPTHPTDAQLHRLVGGWDNPAAGDLDYMRVVIDLCERAEGPVLECGSAYATQPVWTLEADERWFHRVSTEADIAGLTKANIVHAPLEDYGEFFWYALPAGLPRSFSLVICDGPAAGGLKGGRVGLLPVLGDRIESGSPVVVDRGMVYEQDVVAKWEADYGLAAEDTSTPYRIYRTP
jgi:hypothetical protein